MPAPAPCGGGPAALESGQSSTCSRRVPDPSAGHVPPLPAEPSPPGDPLALGRERARVRDPADPAGRSRHPHGAGGLDGAGPRARPAGVRPDRVLVGAVRRLLPEPLSRELRALALAPAGRAPRDPGAAAGDARAGDHRPRARDGRRHPARRLLRVAAAELARVGLGVAGNARDRRAELRVGAPADRRLRRHPPAPAGLGPDRPRVRGGGGDGLGRRRRPAPARYRRARLRPRAPDPPGERAGAAAPRGRVPHDPLGPARARWARSTSSPSG